MAVSELVLVRHGESMGNAAAAAAHAASADVIEVEHRDADVPLSGVGVEQAKALGLGFRNLLADQRPTVVWSSPYVRAQQTARIALDAAGSSLPIAIDERLRDRELGILDLLTTQGVANRYPLEAERRRWLGKFYHRPPGGESWADVALRIRTFLYELEGLTDQSRAVLVCHDALVLVVRYVCEHLTEADLLAIGAATPVLNVSLTQLVRDPTTNGWRLQRFNDVSHLEAADAPVTRHGGDPHVHPNR